MRKFAMAVLLALPLTACTTHEVYLHPQFIPTTATHREVAVLPLQVSISRDRLPKNLKPEDVERMEREEGLAMQAELYNQLLRRSDRYTVAFQDVTRTNVLLERAGLTIDNLNTRTPDELARSLEVDAVISGRIHRSKPMAAGTAIALGVLLGPAFMGNTNQVSVDLQLHNGSDGELLWTYSDHFGGSIGSSPDKLADALIVGVARRFPYQPPKQ
jgi:hypothetical protein